MSAAESWSARAADATGDPHGSLAIAPGTELAADGELAVAPGSNLAMAADGELAMAPCSEPELTPGSERAEWQVAHSKLTELANSKAKLAWEEGRWLRVALRNHVHELLGYGSFAEYVERLFGYGPRFVREKLRVAEALEALPVLSNKLKNGQLSWSTLRELTRVAVPATESDWLAIAEGKTYREVERLVSGHVPGSRPSDAPNDGARRHVLRFEVSGDVLATFREAVARLRREAGESIDDEAVLLLLARQTLGGPSDTGRASYQIALSVCPSCRQGNQQAAGETVTVPDAVVEMAECDAQHLEEGQKASQTIPPATRRAVLHRDGGHCVFPGCRHGTFVDVHHLHPRAEGVDHRPDNLITLCSAHHRALHRGYVAIEGKPSTGLLFRHAEGRPYGSAVTAVANDVRAKAFHALRGLGFAETAARRALATAPRAGHDVEGLLRHCLCTLTERQHGTRQSEAGHSKVT